MATLSMEEYNKIKSLLDGAEKDDTPYPSIKQEEIEVVGDANKTERNTHDFSVTFIVDGKKVVQDFKDVYITPRRSTAIIPSMVEILPIFYKINDDGTVGDYGEREATEILKMMTPQTWDFLYDTVGAILGIEEAQREFMAPGSVLGAFIQFVKEYPETVNEAFDFFS